MTLSVSDVFWPYQFLWEIDLWTRFIHNVKYHISERTDPATAFMPEHPVVALSSCQCRWWANCCDGGFTYEIYWCGSRSDVIVTTLVRTRCLLCQEAALFVLLSVGHSLRKNATRNCSSGVFLFFCSIPFLLLLCAFPLNPPLPEGGKAASCSFVQQADWIETPGKIS